MPSWLAESQDIEKGEDRDAREAPAKQVWAHLHPFPSLWGLHMALVWLLITANTVRAGEFLRGIVGPRAEKMQPVAK